MQFILQTLVLIWIIYLRDSNCVDSNIDSEWKSFKKTFKKAYQTEQQENERRMIWENNTEFIREHNEMANEGYHTFTLKINKYGDMTNKEFNQILNHLNTDKISRFPNPISCKEPDRIVNAKIPESIDWNKLEHVTKVKDQKYCSSGWAFAALASIEARYRNITSRLISFSEQILLDCPFDPTKSSCLGGSIIQGYLDVNWNGGDFDDELHPYIGEPQKCNFSETLNLYEFYVTKLLKIPINDEKKLTELVATVGPIATYINAHDRSFQFYGKGVYSSENCDPDQINHAVTVIGYDTQILKNNKTGLDYYIIKNSYGLDWGMDGYMWLARNQNNMCGIAFEAYSPILFVR